LLSFGRADRRPRQVRGRTAASKERELALSTQTGHPTAEFDSREAVIGGCSRGWQHQGGQALHEI
jgi:hypothetical protein